MRSAAAGILGGLMVASGAQAAMILPETPSIVTTPGQSVSVLWLIEDVQTPLFGYSLDIDTTGPTGGVSIDTDATNFFADRNLILAGGFELDPLFSLIQSDGMGGAFISTNTADGSTVLPTPGVNDVLAEVVFDVSSDALGDYVFGLGPGSALSDGQGFPVTFSSQTLTITVVPAPGGAAAILASAVLVARRRRGS